MWREVDPHREETVSRGGDGIGICRPNDADHITSHHMRGLGLSHHMRGLGLSHHMRGLGRR